MYFPRRPRFCLRFLWIELLLGAALFSAALHAGDHELILPDGQREPMKLTALDEKLRATFASASGETRQLGPEELLVWGARRDAVLGTVVLLVDGSLLVGKDARLVDDHVILTSDLWGEPANITSSAKFPIPLNRVRGLLLRPPADIRERDRLLADLADAKGDEDRIRLENGDLLSGTLLPATDPKLPANAAGPPERPKAEEPPPSLRLEVKGTRETRPLSIPWERIRGLRFSPALAALPPEGEPALRVGLADGALLKVKELRAPASDRTEIELLGGLTLPVSSLADLPAEIVFLRGASSKVAWLSDREGSGYKHWPYLSGEWPLARDRSVGGGQLRAGGRIYDKGLGMHSRSRVIYEVPEDAARFEAEGAIDAAAGMAGSVIFRVFTGDGSGAFKPLAETPIVRGGEAPRMISVDVRGAKQVALVVEYADRGDERDHADWLLARFVK